MHTQNLKPADILEIRKVRWDMLWHVVYRWGRGTAYNRIDRATALRLASQLP